MNRTNSKAKIILTVVVLISTLAFVGLGTYAWYTISTKGVMSGITVSMPRNGDEWPFEFIEMRDDDNWATVGQVMDAYDRASGDGWSKNVTLGMVHFWDGHQIVATPANDCYQLRPVSTSDLVDWYLPEYTGSGEVSNLVKTELKTVGNVNRYNPTPSQTGEDIPSNYVYYYDLWVRTLSNNYEYDIHLNNPFSAEEATNQNYEEYNFGTFVLPGLVKGANGKAELSKCGYDMSTSMRIGFAIYNTDNENVASQSVARYYIYEPNCDIRAQYFEEYGTNTPAGYAYQKNNIYVLGQDNSTNLSVESHASVGSGNLTTLLPYGEDENQRVKVKEFDDITIKQEHCEWKNDIDFTKINSLDSTDIAVFGDFLTHATGKPSLAGIDTPTFATVSKGTPVHIRVFIWMEGQDVDCWNSNLQGSLKIGLEFRGDIASE